MFCFTGSTRFLVQRLIYEIVDEKKKPLISPELNKEGRNNYEKNINTEADNSRLPSHHCLGNQNTSSQW